MNQDDLYIVERWKDIPLDTKYQYQASDLGRISHLYPNGSRKVLKECYIKSMDGWIIGLIMKDGTYRKFQTISLVAKTWIGVYSQEYQAVHVNGIKSDHRVSNIKYVHRKNIGEIANRNKRKTVVKYDVYGNIVDFYPSAKVAAIENHFCYSAMKRRCEGAFVSPLATDGFAYTYEGVRLEKKLILQLKMLRNKESIV